MGYEHQGVHYNMDHKRTASGVAVGGLTTGIIGSALGLMNGGLGNVFGNGRNTTNGYCAEMAEKDQRIAILESENFTNTKLADFADRINTKFTAIEVRLAEQAVYNATNTAVLGCLKGQVNDIETLLGSLTQTKIRIDAICPQPLTVCPPVPAPTTI